LNSSKRIPYPLLWLRSLAFWVVFPISIVLFASLLLFTFPFPLTTRWALLQHWVKFILWWLYLTCRLKYEVHGLEHAAEGPAIVFAKHQSTWETIALQSIFPLQVWVAKRELLWVPFFGWGLALMKCIAIKRGTGRAAIKQLIQQGKARLDEGIWIVIFPKVLAFLQGKRVNTASVALYSRKRPVTPLCLWRTTPVNTGHVAA
jgi:1-acyl-sn-glycerol-3-phosphate acyltransferase